MARDMSKFENHYNRLNGLLVLIEAFSRSTPAEEEWQALGFTAYAAQEILKEMFEAAYD